MAGSQRLREFVLSTVTTSADPASVRVLDALTIMDTMTDAHRVLWHEWVAQLRARGRTWAAIAEELSDNGYQLTSPRFHGPYTRQDIQQAFSTPPRRIRPEAPALLRGSRRDAIMEMLFATPYPTISYERDLLGFEARARGCTWTEIGRAIGSSGQNAHRAFSRFASANLSRMLDDELTEAMTKCSEEELVEMQPFFGDYHEVIRASAASRREDESASLLRRIQEQLADAIRRRDAMAEASLRRRLALQHRDRGEADKALEHATQWWRLRFGYVPDSPEVGEALCTMGWSAERLKDNVPAQKYYAAALKHLRGSNSHMIANVLAGLGRLAYANGDCATAGIYLRQSVDTCRLHDDLSECELIDVADRLDALGHRQHAHVARRLASSKLRFS